MVEAILQAILSRGETNPKSHRIMAGQNHLLEAKTQNGEALGRNMAKDRNPPNVKFWIKKWRQQNEGEAPPSAQEEIRETLGLGGRGNRFGDFD